MKAVRWSELAPHLNLVGAVWWHPSSKLRREISPLATSETIEQGRFWLLLPTIAELICVIIFVQVVYITIRVKIALSSLQTDEATSHNLADACARRTKEQLCDHARPAMPKAETTAVEPPTSILSTNASFFSAALTSDGDVDVAHFLAGLRDFSTSVLSCLGPFTLPARKQAEANIAKIEGTYLLNPDQFRSMRVLLEEELRSQMHSQKTSSSRRVADPSAAMGLLWARRGLQYWLCLFRPFLEGTVGPAATAWDGQRRTAAARRSGYKEALRAYEETFGPYHGWGALARALCSRHPHPATASNARSHSYCRRLA